MEIERIKFIAFCFFIGLIIMLVFNNPIMNLISTSDNSELRMILKASWLMLCVLIGIIAPIGIGKADTQGQ